MTARLIVFFLFVLYITLAQRVRITKEEEKIIIKHIADELKFGDTQQSSYDYFVLALTWPGVICQTMNGPCSVPNGANMFTIHGLWPDRFSSPSPEGCRNDNIDQASLRTIVTEMNRLWPNVKGNGDSFWRYEWQKHGTCGPFPNSFSYFIKTLELTKKLDLLTKLRSRGIVPSHDKQYNLPAVTSAIQGALGVRGRIICHENMFIKEIRICYDKNYNLMNCPVSAPQRCGQKLMLLPY